LKGKVDVISYTGGVEVGRLVARAAAVNLTPVMLELGGKSPVFLTKHADLPSAAEKIAFGKIAGNSGQLCVSPDYVLVEESIKDQFITLLSAALDRMYPASSYTQKDATTGRFGDVGTMISVEHAQRVVSLIENDEHAPADSRCQILYGGKHHDIPNKFVAPTVVSATIHSKIMQHEIFGPLLAVLTVPDLPSAIDLVHTHFTCQGKHPLALYIFSNSKREQDEILNAIPSGGCAINDVIKHPRNHHLPFGGVGTSGMGHWYGKYGFDFYSHHRGVMISGNHSARSGSGFWGLMGKYDPGLWMTQPPYGGEEGKSKLWWFQFMAGVGSVIDGLPSWGWVKHALRRVGVTGVVLGVGYVYLFEERVWEGILDLNLRCVFRWFNELLGST